MNKVTDRYFSILKDYFGLAYKLSSKKKFELEATTKILRDVYDDIVMKSMLDTLSEDLNNLNWSTQETEIRKLTGLKASYLGSKNGCTLKQLTCSVFRRAIRGVLAS